MLSRRIYASKIVVRWLAIVALVITPLLLHGWIYAPIAQAQTSDDLPDVLLLYHPDLSRPGERSTVAWQLALGPYDYWAIEYGYKPIAPEHEKAELQRIAARSSEPQLAYGTDEDNFLGIDPESLHFDLGNDPVAFAKKRFDIARDLIRRQESRELKPNEDYSVLRRSVGFALRDAARASGILARQIGGVRTLRDFPGSKMVACLVTRRPGGS